MDRDRQYDISPGAVFGWHEMPQADVDLPVEPGETTGGYFNRVEAAYQKDPIPTNIGPLHRSARWAKRDGFTPFLSTERFTPSDSSRDYPSKLVLVDEFCNPPRVAVVIDARQIEGRFPYDLNRTIGEAKKAWRHGEGKQYLDVP